MADNHLRTTVVDWTGLDDVNRPANWSPARKWAIVIINSLATFIVSFSSSVFSGAIPYVQQEFNVSANVSLLGISLYVLGFAFGPMVWGPASELYGKRRPLLAGYAAFCIFQVVTGVANSAPLLLVFRFLSALAGSSPLAIMSGMFVEFLTDPTSRGIATAVFSMAVFTGPAAGPIVGNAVAEHLGWRWTVWVTLIFAVVISVAAFLVTPETSEAVILTVTARRLRKEIGSNVVCEAEQMEKPSVTVFVHKYMSKPLRMFVAEPIVSQLFYPSFHLAVD